MSILRTSNSIIERMKFKWTKFLIERVSNKLYIQQVVNSDEKKDVSQSLI